MGVFFNLNFKNNAIIVILLFLSVSPVFSPTLRVLGFLIVYFISIVEMKNFSKNEIMLIFFSISFFLYSLILDLYNLNEYGLITSSFLYILLSFFGGYIVSRRFSFSEYLDRYVNIVYHLSLIAISIFLIVIINPNIINIFFTYEYYGFTSKSVLFLNVLSSETNTIFRNCGFASEPGLYQFFLNVALWWKLKQNNKIDIKIFIFIISIISTNSTMGLLSMFLILFFSSKGNVRLIIGLCSLIFLPIGFDKIQYHLSNKLVGSASFEGRLIPLVNAFEYSLLHPFGVGSIEYTSVYKELKIGGWDSFSQLVLRYGYQGLFVVILCLLNITRKVPILGAVMWLSFLSQAIWFYPVVSCFYFWSFSNIKKDAL